MKLQSKLPAMPVGVSSEVTPAGKAGGQILAASSVKTLAMLGVLSAASTAGMANAAITIPPEIMDVFTDLAVAFGSLMAAGGILFGVIRGGVALFKLAGRVFSAAGA
ncbi:hypothetical protein A9C11_28230 [Pseudomonas citronellolis]|uniref:Uncharacterized protein n=1 Tax=Pseudomonas citronellolis TaxID=53408 RepID=A0A1A9KJC2_9PSED|nr:hypothetical protein [Pseudomonas citronellolis]ANI17635.1 hypothetical protein A9C11_28230 [Pseudomonas citronellolis]